MKWGRMEFIKNEKWALLAVFVSFFAVYSFTVNQCLTIVIDSAGYISEVANREFVFFPHHLLYHVSFYIWSDFLKLFGMSNVVYNTGLFNAFFGSLAMTVFYMILRNRFSIGRLWAAGYLLLPGFSFGFWIVAVSTNVYMVPVFSLLCCYYLFSQPGESYGKWILIAFFHSLAVVYNQWNVFIFPVIILAAWFSSNRRELFRKYIPLYVLILGILVGGIYLLVLILHEKIYSPNEMYAWFTYYSRHFPWTTNVKRIIIDASIGIGQTFIAPYWMFGSGLFAPLLKKFIPGHVSLVEETFFARNFSNTETILFLLLTILVLAGITYIAFKVIRNIPWILRKNNPSSLYLFFWIIFTSAMPLFWSGYNQRYWFTQTTVFFLLAFYVISVKASSGWKRFIPAVTGGLVFLLILFSTMIPGRDKNNDLIYHKLNTIRSDLRRGDLILHCGIWNFTNYIKIYATNTDEARLDELSDSVKTAKAARMLSNLSERLKHGNIYLFKEIIDDREKFDPFVRSGIDSLTRNNASSLELHKTRFLDYYIIHGRK